MAHSLPTSESGEKTTLPPDEQEILDSALLESDQLLVRSLHDDQQRRRRRTIWLSVILVGGVAMTTLVWFIMTGLTAATVSRADINEAQQLSREGWQLWQKQQFAEAEEKFAKSVELNPKDADAWNGLGWTQFNSGQSTVAIKAFKQCVKLKPKHPAGLNGLGQIYLMWGELDQAEKYLKKAAPQAPAAWFGLARLYLIKEDFKKAKPWVERLAEDPNNAEAQRMLEAVKNEELSEDLKIMLQPVGIPDTIEVEEKSDVELIEEKIEINSESDQKVSKATPTTLDQAEAEKWRKRLLSVKGSDSWFDGAQIGMELMRLPGDTAFQILADNWKELSVNARQQILKGFSPGMMGNKKMNSRFFDVMDLGMSDPIQEVRDYAATYLEMQGLPNFSHDPDGYAKWWEANESHTATEIVKENKLPVPEFVD